MPSFVTQLLRAETKKEMNFKTKMSVEYKSVHICKEKNLKYAMEVTHTYTYLKMFDKFLKILDL